MKKSIKQARLKAVQRFLNGEEPEEICKSLGRSRSWLYKWVTRYAPDDSLWFEDQSRLVFSIQRDAPKHPLEKPEKGCYHLVRFIRSDCRLNIFA